VRRERLDLELLFAKDEDYWDKLVGQKEPLSWTVEIRASLEEVILKIKESDRQTKALAEAMWEVVLAERKLADEEEAHRQRKTTRKDRHRPASCQPI
jgi:hypothetical protein